MEASHYDAVNGLILAPLIWLLTEQALDHKLSMSFFLCLIIHEWLHAKEGSTNSRKTRPDKEGRGGEHEGHQPLLSICDEREHKDVQKRPFTEGKNQAHDKDGTIIGAREKGK